MIRNVPKDPNRLHRNKKEIVSNYMSQKTMIRRRNCSRRVLGFILFWGLSGACLTAAPLRLVGSDLLGPRVAATVKAFAAERGIEIELDFQGSLSGRRELEAGSAQVALISASPGDADLKTEYSWEPLGYHVAVLWVPRELSLSQLSYDQIREILSSDKTGARKRWRDFGAHGEGSSRMALAKHVEQASGLSLAILQHKLGITVNPQLTSDSEEGATYDNQEGVRISAYLPQADADWETVAISLKQTGRAYQPTAMNVHRGDYPLSWPLRLAFRRNEVESLYHLLRFLLSEEFAQELSKVGLVSLPETVRGERIFDLERL